LHLAAALGLGGVESNPLSFAAFGGIEDIASLRNGRVEPPPALGVGFEGRPKLRELFASVPGDSQRRLT